MRGNPFSFVYIVSPLEFLAPINKKNRESVFSQWHPCGGAVAFLRLACKLTYLSFFPYFIVCGKQTAISVIMAANLRSRKM